MWQQNMALIEERQKQLEREAAHYQRVRQLRQQQSQPSNLLQVAQAQLTSISRALHNRPTAANQRLKTRKI